MIVLTDSSSKQLEEKIHELKQQTDFYIKELKKAIETITTNKTSQVISYFSSSFNIAYNETEDSLCLGTYHIWNIGDTPLINPSISIKLSENSPFSFSGRYMNNIFQRNLLRPSKNEWVRIQNDEQKNVLIFKPVEKNIIEPNEIISFENFQIKWPSTSTYSGSITGITYCDQFQDGIPAINSINLSIIKQNAEQEGEYE